MKIKAVANLVIFRPLIELKFDAGGLRKQGGIIIPDGAQVNPEGSEDNPLMEVIVIDRGPECRVVSPGDHILVNAKQARRCRVPGNRGEFGLVYEYEIVAVIEDEPKAETPVAGSPPA